MKTDDYRKLPSYSFRFSSNLGNPSRQGSKSHPSEAPCVRPFPAALSTLCNLIVQFDTVIAQTPWPTLHVQRASASASGMQPTRFDFLEYTSLDKTCNSRTVDLQRQKNRQHVLQQLTHTQFPISVNSRMKLIDLLPIILFGWLQRT
jgi:hypothetical protein